jgi:PAS domain S-box-containing protein
VSDQLELRKQALQLRSERRHLELYRRFFDLNLDLLCTSDARGYFLELNDSWTRHLGWSSAELKASPYLERVHPDDQERTLREASRLGRGDGELVAFENHYQHRDGGWVHLAWAAASQGGLIFAAARNVTAERLREATLRAREAHLSALFDAMVEGVVVQDREGRIVECNRAAEQILGLSLAQMQGRTSMDPRWRSCRRDGSPFPGEEHPAMVSLRTGLPVRGVEIGICLPDDSQRWLLVNAQPLFPEAKSSPDAVVCTFHDITDRINAESARRASLLGAILENLPASTLAIFDPALLIEERFGLPIRQATASSGPESLLDWAPDGQKEALQALAQRCLQGAPGRIDWSVDDVHLDIRLAALPGADQGGPRGLALAYDTTERDLLLRRAVSQERLATTGTLAAGVGHEINNPLAFVVSNLEFIHEEIQPSGKSELTEAIHEALEGTERIRKIVRGLQALAREEGAPAPLALAPVVELAARMTQHEWRTRATLSLALSAVPPVFADEGRLVQVIVNLLLNAAQSFPSSDPDRNRISVRTALLEERVALIVSDNGPGIPPDVLPRIFDPFFTTKPVGRGTGLGLAISDSIVRSLGGEIRCETSEGSGTTFQVLLPLAPGHQPGVSTRRVLLVDDEPTVLRAMTRLLQSEYEVVALADPQEALRRIELGERYDVILCDLMMPRLPGVELFRRCRALDGALADRFVFISGGILDQETLGLLGSVRNELLEKPFTQAELRAVLARQAVR